VHERWDYLLDEWNFYACGVHNGSDGPKGGFDGRLGDWETHEFIMQPASRQVEANTCSDRIQGGVFAGATGRMKMSAAFRRCMQTDCCCCRRLLLLFANALIFHLVGKDWESLATFYPSSSSVGQRCFLGSCYPGSVLSEIMLIYWQDVGPVSIAVFAADSVCWKM